MKDLIESAAASGHENEQHTFQLLKNTILAGRHETGLLAMIVGAANHGVKNWPDDKPQPPDPAGLDWKGQSAKKGKHFLDGGRKGYMSSSRPMGGLGIVHADSSLLRRDTYGRWGRPPGIPKSLCDEKSFDQLVDYDSGKYRDEWLDWATPLLDSLDFQVWLAETWLEKYWKPATDTFPRLRDCAVNARIGNSASGLASNLRKGKICVCTGAPDEGDYEWRDLGRTPTVDEQISTYTSYKLAKRGESSAERALRQAKQALRVGEIVDFVGFTPL